MGIEIPRVSDVSDAMRALWERQRRDDERADRVRRELEAEAKVRAAEELERLAWDVQDEARRREAELYRPGDARRRRR